MAVTLTEALENRLDNADYDDSGSVSKAKAFRTACRQLLTLLPVASMRGAGSNQQTVNFRVEEIRKDIESVESWIAINDTTSNPAVVHPDFSFYR